MNLEVDNFLMFFGLREKYQASILTAAEKDEIDGNGEEWLGLVSEVNNNTRKVVDKVRQENKLEVNKVRSEMKDMNTKMKEMNTKLEDKLDA